MNTIGQDSVSEQNAYVALQHWYRRPATQALAEALSVQLAEALSAQFGYFFADLSSAVWPIDVLADCPVRSCIRCVTPGLQGRSSLVTRHTALPLKTASLDGLLLAHVLDYSASPYQVMREAERVLIADGRLYVVGFSPWWLFGMRRFVGKRRLVPWNARFMSAGRVGDLLGVLGFEVEQLSWVGAGLQLPSSRLGRYSASLRAPLYLLQAIKRQMPITPIKPRFRLADVAPSPVLKGARRDQPEIMSRKYE